MELTPFTVDLSDPARPKVEVAGVDVTHSVSRVSLDVSARQFPVLYLEVPGQGTITGPGVVVERSPAPDVDLSKVVPDFLTAIDPKTLEEAVLGKLDGFSSSPIETALEILKEWAGGN